MARPTYYQGLEPVELSAPDVYDALAGIAEKFIAQGYSEALAMEMAAAVCEQNEARNA